MTATTPRSSSDGITPTATGWDRWRDAAACRGVDPEVFFPTDPDGVQAAKAICRACPVATVCLEWAVRTRQGHGVWGGTTPTERAQLPRTRPSCGACQQVLPAAAGPCAQVCPTCRRVSRQATHARYEQTVRTRRTR